MTWINLSRRGGGVPVFGFILLLLLNGCVQPQATPVAVTPPPPMDPILAAVATLGSGQTIAVTAPQYGGSAVVAVQSDYISAAGHECRTYSVAGAAANGGLDLACHDGADWRAVPALNHVGSMP